MLNSRQTVLHESCHTSFWLFIKAAIAVQCFASETHRFQLEISSAGIGIT